MDISKSATLDFSENLIARTSRLYISFLHTNKCQKTKSHSVMEYRTLELDTCSSATHTKLQFLNNFITFILMLNTKSNNNIHEPLAEIIHSSEKEEDFPYRLPCANKMTLR